MRIETFHDASSFLTATDKFFLADEANHNLILGLALMLVQSPTATPSLYAAFYDGNKNVVGAVIWVQGRKLVATACPEEGAELLAEKLFTFSSAREGVAGIFAPFEFATAFAKAWSEKAKVKSDVGIQQNVMRMDFSDRFDKPNLPQGRLRRAWLEDLRNLRSWARSMAIETNMDEPPEETAELTRRMIEARRLFVWDVGGPVAMAGHSGNTPNGARINSVYTPPDQRRKGYARAVTWGVCETLRQSGKKFVCLFADRHNPASVQLYESMGFKIIGTMDLVKFRVMSNQSAT
jgi:uncharacterized protein